MRMHAVNNPNSAYASLILAHDVYDAARKMARDQALDLEDGDSLTVYPDPDLANNTLGVGVVMVRDESVNNFAKEDKDNE